MVARAGKRTPFFGGEMGRIRLRFTEGRESTLSVLEMTTPIDHPLANGFENIWSDLGLRVVHRETHRTAQRVVRRWILTEPGGGSISASRRALVQAAMLEAVERAHTEPPPPVQSETRCTGGPLPEQRTATGSTELN
jgi:hypothetical protein